MKKRLTAMLLVVCMLFTFMPMTAFAEGDYAIGAEITSTEENLPKNIPENTEWVLKDENDKGTQNLVCDNPAHTSGHTANCYGKNLICGHDEGHNPSCYDKTGEWIKCSEQNCLHYHEEGVIFPRNVHNAKLGDGCWNIGGMVLAKAACEVAKDVREFWHLDTTYLDAQIKWMEDVLEDYKNPLDFVHYDPADDANLICSHGDAHTQDCYELLCKKDHAHNADCYETVYTWVLRSKVTLEDIFEEDAVNGIVKTYEDGTTADDLAVWGDDFAFELTTVENVGEDVGPIALEANDVPLAGKNLTVQKTADAQTVLTPGIYQVSEKLTAEQAKKWTTADDLYIFVYTDGTFEYKADAEGEQDASGIQNTPETYTVIYKNGSEVLHSTPNLKYGAATPAYDTAAPEKAGFVFDGWDPAVAPTIDVSIANDDNEIVYTAQWEADENGDQIADKYQRTLTFRVVNGAWNDGETEDVEIVVTLRDASGKLSETGSHTLTAEDLADMPAAGEKPSEGYKAGAWDKALPKAGDVITADARYIYTYVEKPVVNISKELLEPDKQYQNGDSVTYKITVEIVKAADLESITLTEEPGAALLNGAFVLNDGDGNSLIKNLLTLGELKAESGKKKFDAELSGNTLTIKEVDSMFNRFDVNFADDDTFTFYYTAKLGIGSINPDITVKTVDWDEVEAAVKGLKLPAAIEACVLAKLEPAYKKLLDRVDATVGDLNDLIDKTLQEILGSTTENEVTAKDQNCDELGGGKTDPITHVGIAKPDLTVTKTVKEEKIYAPGDTVEYNINVENTGDTLLLGMVVTDIPGKGLINGKLDVPEETVDPLGGRAVKSFLNGKITVEFKFDLKKMLANGFTGLDDLQNAFSKDALMAKLQELANMEKPENAGALLGQIEQAMNDFLAKYEWLDVTVYICDRTVAIGRLDEGESLDFTYTATICQMADGKVTNCAVSALGDKSCVTITVDNPAVPVYFYIEDLDNDGYVLHDIPGNDPLTVEAGHVFVGHKSTTADGKTPGAEGDPAVRTWLNEKIADYSDPYTLNGLITMANEQDGNDLDESDYKAWEYTQVEWIEGDNAWHVHLKLIPKAVVNLTVNYVDEKDNTIQDSKTTQLKEDEEYTIDKSNIVTADGRTYTCIGWKVNDGVLSTDPSVLYSSAIGTSDVTFTLVYQLIQADITFYIRNTVITTDDKRDADITDMPNTHEGYDLIGKKTVGITPKGAALIGADPWYVFDNTDNCKYYFGAYIGENGVVSNESNLNTITLGETGNTVKAFRVTVDGKVFTQDNAILKIVKFGYYDDGYHADCIVIPKTTPVDPKAAVYQTEYYFEQEDGSYQKDDAATVRKTAKLDALVEAERKSFDDYAYDETKTAANGRTSGNVFLPEAIKDGDGNVVGVKILTLKLYYSIDKIGGGKDAEEPDNIPDKYEIIVKYTTDGHGSIEKPKSKYKTFDVRELTPNNDGTYTIRLSAEADANSRYKFKSWTGDFRLSGQDATLDADVDAEVGTYVVKANFKKKPSDDKEKDEEIIEEPEVPQGLNGDDHFQYIFGYDDGTVRPLAKITRAEVAAIFYRLLDDETRELYFTTENDFPDMKDTMWYNKAVSTLSNAGIITGCSDGLFHGGRNITRAELATIIAKFDEITYRGEDLFSDISGHWAREYINSSADKGWIVGDGTGKFRPYDDITRAEVMTMINAVLNRAVDEDGLCDGYKKWPDNTKGTWYYYQVIEATNYHDYEREADMTESWTEILPDKTWDEAGR